MRIVPILFVHVEGQYLETYKVHFNEIKTNLELPRERVRTGHRIMKFQIYPSTNFHETIWKLILGFVGSRWANQNPTNDVLKRKWFVQFVQPGWRIAFFNRVSLESVLVSIWC